MESVLPGGIGGALGGGGLGGALDIPSLGAPAPDRESTEPSLPVPMPF